MRAVRVPTLVLAAGLTIGSPLYAQTAPDITLPPGDAARGKAIFESSKGNCLSCHRVNGTGSLYGPDLSAIGAPPRGGGGGGRGGGGAGGGANAPGGAAAALPGGPTPAAGGGGAGAAPAAAPAGRGAQPINLTPAPTPQLLAQSILDPNAVVSVQNRYVRLTMKDGKTIWGKLLNVDKFGIQILDSNEKLANISKADVREMAMASPMPSYRDKLSNQELADVIGYLMSLK